MAHVYVPWTHALYLIGIGLKIKQGGPPYTNHYPFFYVVFWWIEKDWNILSLAPGIHPISDSYQSWAQPFQATFTDRSQASAPLGYFNTIYLCLYIYNIYIYARILHTVITCSNSFAYNYHYAPFAVIKRPNGNQNGIIYNL